MRLQPRRTFAQVKKYKKLVSVKLIDKFVFEDFVRKVFGVKIRRHVRQSQTPREITFKVSFELHSKIASVMQKHLSL